MRSPERGRTWFAATIAAVLFWPADSAGQSGNDAVIRELATCRAIERSLDRLDCYDRLADLAGDDRPAPGRDAPIYSLTPAQEAAVIVSLTPCRRGLDEQIAAGGPVTLEVTLTLDRRVESVEAVSQTGLALLPQWRGAAEAAVAVVSDARCQPWPVNLSPDRYDQWRVIRLTLTR